MNNNMQYETSFAIAEDEAIERIAMEEFVNGTIDNARVVWTAKDGAEALEKVHRLPPDVLIVDIEMPVVSGLKLCETLYRENFQGVVLIHTAYARFSYAKRAVALNVFDYLLKPMNDEEMKETLERCAKESIQRRKAVQKSQNMKNIVRDVRQYALSLLTLDTSDPQQINLFFRTVGWPNDERLHTWVVMFSSGTIFNASWMKHFSSLTDRLKSEGFLLSSEYIDSQHCLVIIQPEHGADPSWLYTLIYLFAYFSVQNYTPVCVFAWGPFHDYLQIASACHDAVSSGSHPGLTHSPVQMPKRTWQIISKKEGEKIRGRLNRYLRDRDISHAIRYVQRQLLSFGENQDAAFWEIVPLLLEVTSGIWPLEDYSSLFLDLFSDTVQPDPWLEQFALLLQSFPLPSTGGALEDILAWMKANPADDITLSKAAEKMGMDPAYFSRYFKKTVGSNFSDVLTRIRLEHCEKLLRQHRQISLEELSVACGFSSKTYFCEVFRKWKGITLTQYLKNMNRENAQENNP